MKKILIVQTPPLNPCSGGVQRITYNLGNFFHQSDYEVHFYSFAKDGHIDVEKGYLHHPKNVSGVDNYENRKDLKVLLLDIQPDFVTNQMPYEKQLTRLLFSSKRFAGYRLLGCIHNSLFNSKDNIRDVLGRKIPSFFFPQTVKQYAWD